MNKTDIQLLAPKHISEMMNIERASFPDPWSEKMFQDELQDDGHRLSLVMIKDGSVIGYAVGWVVLDEFHLGNIAIEKSFRKNGYGEYLLKDILFRAYRRGCRIASLEVRASNQSAIDLYKKYNFRPIAIRKKYYQNEDALVMLAEILPDKLC